MSENVVIGVNGLWKRYGLPLPNFVRQSKKWLRTLCDVRNSQSPISTKAGGQNAQSDDGPWALRDVSFEVRRGEIMGIIGRNGAGKSTLLKVLAGVTPPTQGKVEVQGQIFSMIELNAGLHMELTGRENVRLLGAIMGLSRSEIKAKMPEIMEFCDLGEWFDRKVRMYSSGMLVRLGFGVALHVNASILLIDEVLAVGDIVFRQKCVRWLDEHRHKDSTVLLVSHSLNQIERLCDRAMYLDQGEICFIGDVKETCSHYYESTNDEIMRRIRVQSKTNPLPIAGSDEIGIQRVQLLDAEGNDTDRIFHGTDLRIIIELMVNEFVKAPNFTVLIIDSDLIPVAHTTTLGKIEQRPDFPAGFASVECCLQDLQLLKGVYTVDVGMANYQGGYRIGGITSAAMFQVIETIDNYHMLTTGHFALPAEWNFEPSNTR